MMEELKVCRICLIMDVNMYNLQTQPLGTYFEPIIGVNPLCTTTELPRFACFECATLVKKYYYFRDKCLRGQASLYSILHERGKITKEEINKINRTNLNLTSNHTIHKIPQEDTICHLYSESFVSLKIKQEPVCDDKKSVKSDKNIKQEDVDGVPSIDDDDIPSLPSSDDYDLPSIPPSDDEDPLFFSSSRRKMPKRKCVKERKVKCELNENDNNDDDDSPDEKLFDPDDESSNMVIDVKPSMVIPNTKKRVRRTRAEIEASKAVEVIKPPRKKPYDIEKYTTVIHLSMEEQIEEINKRKESSNYLNAPFQCNLCYKGFIDTHTWSNHNKKHAPSAGDKECVVCKMRFKTNLTLYKHSVIHKKRYACKMCPYVSKIAAQAKLHQNWHQGVTYTCQHCGEVINKWTSYLSHVRKKHPSEFICGVCGYSFVSKLGLNMHITMMHKDVVDVKIELDQKDEEDGPYCEECDVKFVSTEAFKRHMIYSVKHAQTTTFNNACRSCGETFTTLEELKVHRKEHAKKCSKYYDGKKHISKIWPSLCEHCNEEIPSAFANWNHYRRVHPDKHYPIQKDHTCDVCGKSFKNNTFLVYHKRTHTDEKRYKCLRCEKAFHNRINLYMHEKSHSDVRPYPCNDCGKAFKFKSALDRHIKCHHLGLRPYECGICGKAFGLLVSKELHVRTVHLKQPGPKRNRRKPKVTIQ